MNKQTEISKLSTSELYDLLGTVACSVASKETRDKVIADIEAELQKRHIPSAVEFGEIKAEEF
jgi:hypothetical protein